MKVNELRIGNYVHLFEKGLYKVHTISMKVIQVHGELIGGEVFDIASAQPIPLTPSILEAAGFKKSPANNSYYISFPEMKSEIHFEEFRGGLVCVLYQSVGSFIPTKTSHLHQLQNLVYCITGTELEIDIEKLNP